MSLNGADFVAMHRTSRVLSRTTGVSDRIQLLGIGYVLMEMATRARCSVEVDRAL
jgi:hypothetical protein